MKKLLSALLCLLLLLSLTACGGSAASEVPAGNSGLTETVDDTTANSTTNTAEGTLTSGDGEEGTTAGETLLDEDGWYYAKEDVCDYLVTYGRLPGNFITKSEARELGWEGGSVEKYAPGCAIGGDRFGNREGILPEADGRTYTECDIDTLGASSRGAKRIVFSNDGLIYYTEDHYESFELLYGEE